jgi:hypothetical protein
LKLKLFLRDTSSGRAGGFRTQIKKAVLLIQRNQQDRFSMLCAEAYHLQATGSLAENKTNRFSALVIKPLSKNK